MKRCRLLLLALVALDFTFVAAQVAKIWEEEKTLKTYSFHDPDPVPILTDNTKIYPYFKYEGYEHEGVEKKHTVVTLENQYIQVFVLPNEGGKVWGAVEKSTGQEFIYRNEVVKFRNIAMRGPWTSGGIEFNFGIIGHSPSTASPVDYSIATREDGSVVCTVGNIDLPSRTHWIVKIILLPDKAYFETQTVWYNPTPMHQSYYNWMTAAAEARQDLVFYTPGDQYLKHSGEAMPWPYDSKGRHLAAYKENNFGPAKSYHVVGEYNDFFGGYYSETNFGFGHWSPYEETPGQKLWIWALSRSGGIWEDLLTDTDGQYIEWQAGRLFDQYSPGDHVNPITQVTFPPNSSDTWREIWFPVKEIGGLSDVSPRAVLHMTQEGNKVSLNINGLASSQGTLSVIQGGQTIHSEAISLTPMQVIARQLELNTTEDYEVMIPEMGLHYYSNPEKRQLKRPFQAPELANTSDAEQLYFDGMEAMKFREFDRALELFLNCLVKDEANQRARVALGELYYRRGEYHKALEHINVALAIDTYNPDANYTAGIIYAALDDHYNALESLGWSARSMTYRSAAYAMMSEIALKIHDLESAGLYAGKSVDYNRFNVNAHQVRALVAKRLGHQGELDRAIADLLELDPINHFAHYSKEGLPGLVKIINNELPYQSYLELAITYFNRGDKAEALAILEKAPSHPVIDIWIAYLDKNQVENRITQVIAASPAFVFPYRRETIEVLEWANAQRDHWKLKYYLGLIYWGKGRTHEAAAWMTQCADQPDYAPFYLARADLMTKEGEKDVFEDIAKAYEMDSSEWRTWDAMIDFYKGQGDHDKTLQFTRRAYQKFPKKYDLGLRYSDALLNTGKHEESIDVLDKIQILPFEHSYGARTVYEQAHLLRALELIEQGQYAQAKEILLRALEWPENIGVGKPYDPDERPQNILLAHVNQKLGEKAHSKEYLNKVVAYTIDHPGSSPNTLLGLLALKESKKKDEERQLVDRLNSQGGDLNKWILAKYQGDQAAMNSLSQVPLNQDKDIQILDQINQILN